MFTEFALATLSPLGLSFFRVFFGFVTLLVLVPIFRRKKSKDDVPVEVHHIPWYMYALIGFLEGVLPCYLVPLGQQQISSGIASVLISTMPIFAVIFGALMIKNERLTFVNVLSIIIGFIGVCILIKPSGTGQGLINDMFPELMIILAAASWALSLAFIKKLPLANPFIVTRNILFAATLEIIPIWFIFGHPLNIHFTALSLTSAIILGVVSSGIAYIFYVYLIRLGGVAFASFSNYIVPVVGVGIGLLVLGETFEMHQIIGTVIIIAALGGQSLKRNKTL